MSAVVAARRALQAGLALAIALAVVPGAAVAQSPGVSHIKGAFVYNFLKFAEWPVSAFRGPADSLIVGIFGRGQSAEAAAIFLAGKQVNQRAIAVRRLADADVDTDDIMKLHAVFIGGSDGRRSRQVVESFFGRSVLLIGESARFVQDGGAIGMAVDDERVRFDVNLEAATAARLRISSRLLALARRVFGDHQELGP